MFVIGATNRPDLLDPALERPGRFDRLIYLAVSTDRESQRRILRALTRKFVLEPGFDEDAVLARCAPNLTGADFYALCADAMLNAVRRRINVPSVDAIPAIEDSRILVVTTSDFVAAADHTAASVSAEDLQRYEESHAQFS